MQKNNLSMIITTNQAINITNTIKINIKIIVLIMIAIKDTTATIITLIIQIIMGIIIIQNIATIIITGSIIDLITTNTTITTMHQIMVMPTLICSLIF
ncbi:MAG: hypothetical protein E2O67_05830 [Deltaproteobacteria bacterium]|nr:hypothetical protein [Candidatus Dadabacteria bacterium]TDJ05073.1 MAG: hypothetical protein E2O67_05830 [Deltaproteobacteria bacterium]